MRYAGMCLAGAIGLAVIACGGTAEQAAEVAQPAMTEVSPQLLSDGRRAYRKYCVQCHGYSGKGDGTSAAHLDPPPRDHTSTEQMDPITDALVAETVRFGGQGRGFPNMPAFPHLEGEELVALVAYVRSLSQPDVTHIEIGNAEY